MKLALNNLAHYTDFSPGYDLYVRRSKTGDYVSLVDYKKIVRKYCSILKQRLLSSGMVDLPSKLGMITAAIITRKPQFRGNKFIGYGKMDWEAGHYDGKLKAFGLVFLPKHDKANLRCYGFVANRKLFAEMKEACLSGAFRPMEFNEEMI